MSQFPVNTEEGLYDAVNYLASGPSGLGQNFQGFSAYLPAYLRESGRQPWSLPINTTLDPSVYLSIPISNITVVGGNPSALFEVTFTTPFADAPFEFGDKLDISGVIETGSDTSFNDVSFPVFSCTTTTVTLGYSATFPVKTWNTYVSGGLLGRDYMNYPMATDCNGRVSVQSATTQVFVSAQMNASWKYTCVVGGDYDIIVSITKLRGFPSQTPGSTEYLFADEVLVSEKTFTRTATVGTGTDSLEAIFSTILDGPDLDFGYYWYILNLQFNVTSTASVYDTTIGKVTMGLRSLTSQVIKQ
jgi:hypothetical protein